MEYFTNSRLNKLRMKNFTLLFYWLMVLWLGIISCGNLIAQTHTAQIGKDTLYGNNSLFSPLFRQSATSAITQARSNILFTEAELLEAGIIPGSIITALAFNKRDTFRFVTPAEYKIYMASSTNLPPLLTSTTWASLMAYHSLVYSTTSFNVPAAAGWATITLHLPFLYTGGSMEIATETFMGGSGGTNGAFQWAYSAGFGDYVIGSTALPASGGTVTLNQTGTTFKQRPNIRITYTLPAACTNPPVAGKAVSDTNGTLCNGDRVMLDLIGNSFASGQTYEWESSASDNPFVATSLSAPSASRSLTIHPTQSRYYRCKVVCNGGTAAYSTTLHIPIATPLSGSYTVNDGAAASATNFTSLKAAADALNCAGVSGPVIINLVSGSGPYTEAVTFGDILGVSPTNTVSIHGNGTEIRCKTSINDRHLLKLLGTRYLSIRDVKFTVLDTVYGYGALINGGARYDSIINCDFDISAVTSVSANNSGGIVFSGLLTSAVGANADARHCYIGGNKIIGNTVNGGPVYGIILAPGADSNVVYGNTVVNYQSYGIYVSAMKNRIEANEMHRSTKTLTNTHYGIYGINNIAGTIINANRIHTPGGVDISAVSICYGILLTNITASQNPIIVSNNVYYKANQGGTNYGIYLANAPNVKVYHNTVVLDQVLTGIGMTVGIYSQANNTDLEVKNNIVYLTKGSEGIKYGVFYDGQNSISDVQGNNIYVNSTQPGAQYYGAFSQVDTFRDLSAFQVAYSNLEKGSLSVDPKFANSMIGDFSPTNHLLAFKGEGMLHRVPEDIQGHPRPSAPTIGAYEMPLATGSDAGIFSLVTPFDNYCANTQQVRVTLGNRGNVRLNNVQVHWQLNSVAQAPYTYAGYLDTVGGAGKYLDTIVLGSALFRSGDNEIRAWAVVANDMNTANDTLTWLTAPKVFSLLSSTDTICPQGLVKLQLLPSTGYESARIQWQSSVNGNTYTDITGADQPVFSTTEFTADRQFRAWINSGTNGCYSDTFSVHVINLQLTQVKDSSRCGPGTVHLGVTASAGAEVQWYEAPSGGNMLASGATYITPSISNTTTYYAAAALGVVEQVGRLQYDVTPSIAINDWGLVFDILKKPIILSSVDIYSTGTAGGTLSVKLVDRTGAVLATAGPFNYPGGSSAAPVKVTLPLSFHVPVGSGYRLLSTGVSGTGLIREILNVTFPYTSASGNVSITSGFGLTNTNNLYSFFYNWQLLPDCTGARVPVVATINAVPTVSGTGVSRCGTGTLSLSASSTNSGAIFHWFTSASGGTAVGTGATFTTPTLNATTTYYVSATANGCSSDRIPVVATVQPLPVATVTGDSLCGPGTLSLSASSVTTGANFQWFTAISGGTAVGTGATFITPTLSTTTTYYVSATANSCTGERTAVQAIIYQNPVVNLGVDTAICEGSVLNMDATITGAGYAYLWDDGSTAPLRDISAAGTYSLTVTDANRCNGTDAISVIVNSLPVVDLGGDTTICAGMPLVLDAGHAGASYLWNDGTTGQTLAVDKEGMYAVVVSDNNNCVGSDSIAVSLYPVPEVSRIAWQHHGEARYTFEAKDVQNAEALHWDFGDGIGTAMGNNVDYTYTTNGAHTVSLIVSGICDSIKLTEIVDVSLSIIKVGNADQLMVYPNPAKDILIVEEKGAMIIKRITLYNVLGQQVYDGISNSSKKHGILLSSFAQGLYTLKIDTDKGQVVRKVDIIR